MSTMQEFSIAIPNDLAPYVPDALARFGYLYPSATATCDGGVLKVSVSAETEENLGRELMFCLYRQKIFTQTLPLRQTLIEGITGHVRRPA